MKGFITFPSYEIEGNNAVVTLYGRLENGESFLARIPKRPYFYIKKSDLKKAQKIAEFDFEETNKKSISKEEITKIIVNIPKEVKDLRKLFEEQEIICYEADIRFEYRYLMDMNLKGSLEINGEFKGGDRVDRLYENPEISPSNYIPKNLKVLSFDIEAHHQTMDLYAISLYSSDYEKNVEEVLFMGESKKAACFDKEQELFSL